MSAFLVKYFIFGNKTAVENKSKSLSLIWTLKNVGDTVNYGIFAAYGNFSCL